MCVHAGRDAADVSGAYFGELEFLGLASERSNDIKAKSYCELSSLHPKDVEDIIRTSPQLQDRLHKYVELKMKLAELAYVFQRWLAYRIDFVGFANAHMLYASQRGW
eukprot:COSAG02_NODE_5436_length_4332_cov_5.473659_3_plen_107_part_00